ncbi:MAG: methyltransferase domain-containing protein [Acidimicrobiales bacterium]
MTTSVGYPIDTGWPTWTRFALCEADFDRAIRRLEPQRPFDRWVTNLKHRVLSGTGFPPLDRAKRWDEANVVELLSYWDRNLSMLDCGAYNSPAPWAASRVGVRRVAGIDLNPRVPMSPRSAHVTYSCQNMMATAYHDHTFDLIVAGSVVEHGVDWNRWLAECRRIVKPGGLVYVSTDLVAEHARTEGLTAFGLPWTPLRPSEIAPMADVFALNGFFVEAVDPPKLPQTLPVEFLGVGIGFVAFAARAV